GRDIGARNHQLNLGWRGGREGERPRKLDRPIGRQVVLADAAEVAARVDAEEEEVEVAPDLRDARAFADRGDERSGVAGEALDADRVDARLRREEREQFGRTGIDLFEKGAVGLDDVDDDVEVAGPAGRRIAVHVDLVL